MNKKAMEQSTLYALMGLILGVMIFVPLSKCAYDMYYGQSTFDEKDSFNIVIQGINKLDTDESRQFVLVLNKKSGLFFFNKDAEKITYDFESTIGTIRTFEVEKPNNVRCSDTGCVCLCSKCSFIESDVDKLFNLKGSMVCQSFDADEFYTDQKKYMDIKGGIVYENGLNYAFQSQKRTVYGAMHDNYLGVCDELPCER